jgi:hypothetical protein
LAFFNKPEYIINYQSFRFGFQFVFDLIIGISIALAVIIFTISAFQGMIDGSDIKSIKKGKDGMVRAIVGLMIILSTWLIINTINPDLLNLPMFSGLDQIKTGGTTPGGASTVTAGSNP